MAVVPAPAIRISGPGVYPVPYPGGGTQPAGASHQWTQIKLENASPFPMVFALGGTPVHSLPAGIADVFPLTLGPSGPGAPSAAVDAPAQPLTVTAGAPQATSGQTAGTLTPSFGQYGDRFPGAYPVTLPGILFAAQLAASAGPLLVPTSISIPSQGGGAGATPVVNVQNMAELLIRSNSFTGTPPTAWAVLWFADPAGLVGVGTSYAWNVNTTAPHLLPIAPQGPYCQVQAQALGAGLQNGSVSIVGFPQPADRGSVLPPSAVLSMQGVSVPGLSTVSQNANQYAPGRYRIWGGSQTAPSTIRISRLNNTGTYDQIWQIAEPTVTVGITDEVILPADDWQATLLNTSSTPETFYLTVTGPLS